MVEVTEGAVEVLVVLPVGMGVVDIALLVSLPAVDDGVSDTVGTEVELPPGPVDESDTKVDVAPVGSVTELSPIVTCS